MRHSKSMSRARNTMPNPTDNTNQVFCTSALHNVSVAYCQRACELINDRCAYAKRYKHQPSRFKPAFGHPKNAPMLNKSTAMPHNALNAETPWRSIIRRTKSGRRAKNAPFMFLETAPGSGTFKPVYRMTPDEFVKAMRSRRKAFFIIDYLETKPRTSR